MNVRRTIVAALRRDPRLLPKVTESLRERIEEKQGPLLTVVQAAEALEPVLAEAVEKRPSWLGEMGLKSTHLLATLTAEDSRSNSRLASIAEGSVVGIVFVDVANFTSLTLELGDRRAIRLIRRLTRLIDKSVGATKGQVVKKLGDGFLLAFPSASQAVRGALTLRDAVLRERRKDPELAIDLRIAVHAGEPLVEEDDLLGHDVNLTARLLDHCDPGEIVVSEAAKEQAERRLRKISFANERRVKIRGLSTKVTVYSANHGNAAARPPASTG